MAVKDGTSQAVDNEMFKELELQVRNKSSPEFVPNAVITKAANFSVLANSSHQTGNLNHSFTI